MISSSLSANERNKSKNNEFKITSCSLTQLELVDINKLKLVDMPNCSKDGILKHDDTFFH